MANAKQEKPPKYRKQNYDNCQGFTSCHLLYEGIFVFFGIYIQLRFYSLFPRFFRASTRLFGAFYGKGLILFVSC